MEMACKICGTSDGNRCYQVREMMYGLRERFSYLECSACGCLQLVEAPSDMSRYYPADYYSFDANVAVAIPAWRRWLTKKRYAQELFGNSMLGSLLNQYRGRPPVPLWLQSLQLRPDDRILDVGCGSGSLLRELYTMGFRHLHGVDPYVKNPVHDEQIQIFQKQLHDMRGTYDVIMFHHAFEHLSNPLEILQQVSALLASGGSAIIRIPLMGKYVWRTYGVDWAAIDAPRHFFLHTEKSIQHLAQAVGFTLEQLVYDSTAFQFWGSEQIRQEIPIRDPRSYATTRDFSLFTEQQMQGFRATAKRLNDERDGDQGCFVLRKI